MIKDAPERHPLHEPERDITPNSISQSGKAHDCAVRTPTSENSKARKKRRPTTIGRYPFRKLAKDFERTYKYARKKSTLKQYRDRLWTIARDVEKLAKDGTTTTHDPRHLTDTDLAALFSAWADRGLDPVTQKNYKATLKMFLDFVGNPLPLPVAVARNPKPIAPKKPVIYKDEDEIGELLTSAFRIGGWRGRVIRFILPMYVYLGLRHTELRTAQMRDIDTKAWTFYVRHPKGEGTYGQQVKVGIPAPLRPVVALFIEERAEYLAKRGFGEAEPLIPRYRKKKMGYYAKSGFRDMVNALPQDLNIKDLRASYAVILEKRGMSVERRSAALRHNSTKTTEAYYSRLKYNQVADELLDLWDERPIGAPEPKTPELRPEISITGYG